MNEPNNPINPAILAMLRYGLTILGGYIVHEDGALLNTLVGGTLVVVSTGYGMWTAYRNAKTIKKAAPYTPDTIINSK